MTDTSTVRVRFAPSPTGFLHVGGARTALFNWLIARRTGGVFVLRIEDTDRERSDDAMTQAILDGMTWLGLDWDEGPVHQADGLQRHRTDALRLLENGRAYRCFCTAADLDARRAAHPDGPNAFRYDRRCAAIPAAESADRADSAEPHTVRFLVPEGTTRWTDAVHGDIEFMNTDIEDSIILRTDATPIYNLAVVSDDVDMRITLVIRGDDHISNTPKQVLLYEALEQPVPQFAHVPMILGADGRRLSKRHGATAVGEYATQGILPDALVNFLALLGWSPGTEQEIFSRDELIAQFTLENINRKSAVFDPQKLDWMNGRYLAARPAAELLPEVRNLLGELADSYDDAWWTDLLELLKVRSRTVIEIAEQARIYAGDDVAYDPDSVAKHWKDTATVVRRLEHLAAAFAALDPWTEAAIEESLRRYAEAEGVGAGKVIHPLRVALTGSGASPGIFEIARLLGRERVVTRIGTALDVLRNGDARQD